MTPATCSHCLTPCPIGMQVVTVNPWTKKYDLFRYCRVCARMAGEFDPPDRPDAVVAPTRTAPKSKRGETFAMQLEAVKR